MLSLHWPPQWPVNRLAVMGPPDIPRRLHGRCAEPQEIGAPQQRIDRGRWVALKQVRAPDALPPAMAVPSPVMIKVPSHHDLLA